MPKTSAGLLPYRRRSGALEVFLVHPGGPLWERKDLGSWSLAKGEYVDGEDPWGVALREFEEEVGVPAPSGPATALRPLRLPSGKIITAWAIEADFEVGEVRSNLFEMEWPRGSGKFEQFPEVDRAEWFAMDEAERRLLKGQRPFLEMLLDVVAES